jgi:protein-S-isoprenylcysteine O-methyltransferase Ste14
MVIGFFLLAPIRLLAVLAPRFVSVAAIWPRVGLALTILGLGFAAWARIRLGRFWSGTVTLKENHELVRSGPYAFVRHPIYTGLLTAAAGTALARGTFAALLGLGLIGVACWLKIHAEENLLTNYFGDTYREYRRQVAALIPFVR